MSDIKNCYLVTREYYFNWLDIQLKETSNPLTLAKYSAKRDQIQVGYTQPFSLYSFILDTKSYISYSSFMEIEKDFILNTFNDSNITQIINELKSHFKTDVNHTIKYFLSTINYELDTSQVVQLQTYDYDKYFEFFVKNNPKINDTSWIKEYFLSLVERGYCWGIKDKDHFVCISDSPDVPYMCDTIVEIGINTLYEYRQKGYALKVCSAFIKHLINEGKVPIWSCDSHNVPSIKLAETVGFKKLGDVITLTLN